MTTLDVGGVDMEFHRAFGPITRRGFRCPNPFCRVDHTLTLTGNSYNDGETLGIMLDSDLGAGFIILDYRSVMLLRSGLDAWIAEATR